MRPIRRTSGRARKLHSQIRKSSVRSERLRILSIRFGGEKNPWQLKSQKAVLRRCDHAKNMQRERERVRERGLFFLNKEIKYCWIESASLSHYNKWIVATKGPSGGGRLRWGTNQMWAFASVVKGKRSGVKVKI